MVKYEHLKWIQITILSSSLGTLSLIGGIYLKSLSLCIIGTIFIGIGGSLGSLTITGFIKDFDPEICVGFSSGTGGAGMAGSAYYLLMIHLKVPYYLYLGFILILQIAYY